MLKNINVVFKFYPLLLSLIPNYIDCLGLQQLLPCLLKIRLKKNKIEMFQFPLSQFC